jgi:hypothetical protein
MQTSFWNDTIFEPLRRFGEQARDFLLNNFLGMLVVLAAGVVVAMVARGAVTLVLRAAAFDRFCERHGIAAALKTAGVERTPTNTAARMAYWFVMFVFLMLSLAALNIEPVNDLVSRFFVFVPQVIAALLILLLGYIGSVFVHRATLLTAVNAGVARARPLATAVQILILLFTFALALEQAGIGRSIVLATFSVAFGSVGLATALAFGYAARDLAKTILERQMTPPTGDRLGGIEHL